MVLSSIPYSPYRSRLITHGPWRMTICAAISSQILLTEHEPPKLVLSQSARDLVCSHRLCAPRTAPGRSNLVKQLRFYEYFCEESVARRPCSIFTVIYYSFLSNILSHPTTRNNMCPNMSALDLDPLAWHARTQRYQNAYPISLLPHTAVLNP